MVTFLIYSYPTFEELHKDYFRLLLEILEKKKLLSANIDELVITDRIDDVLEIYCKNRLRQPNLTRNREFLAVSKIVDFDGKKKIFFDATQINKFNKQAPKVFFELLTEVYAEDIVAAIYPSTKTFTADTPIAEIIEMLFFQWSTMIIGKQLARTIGYESDKNTLDVKMFVSAFKRSIKTIHYKHQADLVIDKFWTQAITDCDYFIRRCLDVEYDEGDFSQLQEFKEIVPAILNEIQLQTHKLIAKDKVDLSALKLHVIDLFKICFIKVASSSQMQIEIIDSPKRLFRGNLVDTEPRLIAFIDILGFSSIIQQYDSDPTSNILNELHDTLELAVKVSIENMVDSKAQTDLKEFLEYRMFSDCICISLPYIEYGNDFHIQFHSLATVVKSYQLSMMQKGFFVRGGISVGSFFANEQMIFSGGLVSAYKLEQVAGYPVIAVDKPVLERLKRDFIKNSRNLFYDRMFVFSTFQPEIIFLNPLDLLDNAGKYLDYLQSSFDNLIKENDADEGDPMISIVNYFLKTTNEFIKPLLHEAKSKMTHENMNAAKEEILKYVEEQIEKQQLLLATTNFHLRNKKNTFSLWSKIFAKKVPESRESIQIKGVLSKYEFLKDLIKWSLNIENDGQFHYFNIHDE
jgi:hypothetical protein